MIDRIDLACNAAHAALNKIFPRMVKNLLYQHHDAAGYWFTFQLVNDGRVQTYCVRHSDL